MPTDEERERARKAQNQRDRRARQKLEAEKAKALAASTGDSGDASPAKRRKIRLYESTLQAIEHMKWLKPTDFALRDQALLYAGMIDDLLYTDPTATGRAASLGQLYARLITQLGGAPTVRLQHELRSLRLLAGVNESDLDDDDQQPESKPEGNGEGATITPIRPPKRRRA